MTGVQPTHKAPFAGIPKEEITKPIDPISATRMGPAIDGMKARLTKLEEILDDYETLCGEYDDMAENMATQNLEMADVYFRFTGSKGSSDVNIELGDEYPQLREEIARLVLAELNKKVQTFMERVEAAKQAI